MRLASVGGRAALCSGDQLIDIQLESGGRLPSSPNEILADWERVREWADRFPPAAAAVRSAEPPVPSPRQIFAVGLNYRGHAKEIGSDFPEDPVVFSKFQSSLTAGDADIVLPPGRVDWEAEIVAVVGRGGRAISEDRAWDYLAGVMVGQDLSERTSQLAGPAPQFSLAKSHEGFSPTGPVVVTRDELRDPNAIEFTCELNGDLVQRSSTADLIFSVPDLVARLARVVELYPGDLIFSGTPAGIGSSRQPPRFLSPGDTLVTSADEIGTITQSFR